MACGILVPHPGIEPTPSAVKSQSSDHYCALRCSVMSNSVLRQECWDLCSPQTTLPWIPHTSLHRTSTQVVRTISGWSRGVASTKSSLGSSPSCGVTVIASRERAWCPGPPSEALVSSAHISDQAGFSSSFDPKVFRRVISPHLGGHGLSSLWCSPSLAHVWICCILVQVLVQQH